MTVSASLRASISSRAAKSASACSNESSSIRSTSSSVRPYDGLTSIVCSMSVRSSRAVTLRMPLASIWNCTCDARQAGRHRRNAAQLEPRQRAAVGDQLALALQHVDVDRGLVVDAGREHLAAGRRNRRVAQDDLRHHAAHRLDAERQRRDVEQQHLAVAGDEDVGLHRGAERDDLVGIELAVRRPAEQLLDQRGARAGCASSRRPARLRRSATARRPASASAWRHGPSVRSTSGRDQRLELGARDALAVASSRRRRRLDTDLRLVALGQIRLRLDHRLAERLDVDVGRRRCGRADSRSREHLLDQQRDRCRRRRGACRRWSTSTWNTPSSTRRIEMSNVPPPRS